MLHRLVLRFRLLLPYSARLRSTCRFSSATGHVTQFAMINYRERLVRLAGRQG